MRKLFIVLVVFFCFDSWAQVWPTMPVSCHSIKGFGELEVADNLLLDLENLMKITLGDTGEGSSLQPFENIVFQMDSIYSDSSLIHIISEDYCPLIKCYAFTALACKDDSLLTDSMLVDLILPFASRNDSFITLDWGCGWHNIETFEYLLEFIDGPSWIVLPNTEARSFDNSSVLRFLDARQDFYLGENTYDIKMSWEEYRSSFL